MQQSLVKFKKKLSPFLFNLRFCRVLQLQVTPAVFLHNRRPATCAIYKDHARRIQFGRCRLKEANEEFKETRWSGGKLVPKFWHSWYTIDTYCMIPFSLTWELSYWQTAPNLEPRDTIISFRYFGVWFYIECKITGKSRGTANVKPNIKMFKQDDLWANMNGFTSHWDHHLPKYPSQKFATASTQRSWNLDFCSWIPGN